MSLPLFSLCRKKTPKRTNLEFVISLLHLKPQIILILTRIALSLLFGSNKLLHRVEKNNSIHRMFRSFFGSRFWPVLQFPIRIGLFFLLAITRMSSWRCIHLPIVMILIMTSCSWGFVPNFSIGLSFPTVTPTAISILNGDDIVYCSTNGAWSLSQDAGGLWSSTPLKIISRSSTCSSIIAGKLGYAGNNQ